MEGLVVFLLMVGGIIAYCVATSIFNGWVLTKLWLWFIVPTFGLKPLNIAAAIGLSMVVSFLTHTNMPSTSTSSGGSKFAAVASVLAKPFIGGVIVLLIGLIVKSYM